VPSVGTAAVQAVTCSSASSCAATGWYEDSSGNQQGLLLALSGTSWTAAEAPLPAGAAVDPYVALASVACLSAVLCVTAGYYIDSSGNQQGLLLTGSGSSWTAAKAPLPAGASVVPGVWLSSVSCGSASTCAAAGWYKDSSGNQQGLLLTRSGASWTPAEAALPDGAAAQPSVDLDSVACQSASACTAVGWYFESSSTTEGLLLTGPD
jgi:hypothetical protein